MTGFEPRPEDLRSLLHDLVDRIVDARAELPEARVFTPPRSAELRALIDRPTPDQATDLRSLIDRFFDEWLPRGTRVDHPRFFAFIPCPGSAQSLIGAFLSAASNLFSGSFLGGTFLIEVEHLVLRWLADAMGLPTDMRHGIVTTGGSMANLGGLAAARQRAEDQGAELQTQRVYTSSEAHYSVQKASRVLGYRRDQCQVLPTDGQQRLDARALERRIEQDLAEGHRLTTVVVTAGTTSTGALDPIDAVRDLADRHGLWMHVDAAYGGALAILPEEEALRSALGRADSITIDAHKWLYASIETACLLTRHVDDLVRAFGGDGAYLQDVPRDETNFFERGPELTRGARCLRLWTLFEGVGFDALRNAVRHDCAMAHRAAERLTADPRFELATEVRMSMFSFQFRDGQRTRRLLELLHRDGVIMLSSTDIDGRFALRVCVVNQRTTESEIDQAIAHVLALANEIDEG
ncbi:MAG: aminotransferase class V-fold PLP-dependent enzyme [Planctomycetota bacterium]